jgi:hypothetical protein
MESDPLPPIEEENEVQIATAESQPIIRVPVDTIPASTSTVQHEVVEVVVISEDEEDDEVSMVMIKRT